MVALMRWLLKYPLRMIVMIVAPTAAGVENYHRRIQGRSLFVVVVVVWDMLPYFLINGSITPQDSLECVSLVPSMKNAGGSRRVSPANSVRNTTRLLDEMLSQDSWK